MTERRILQEADPLMLLLAHRGAMRRMVRLLEDKSLLRACLHDTDRLFMEAGLVPSKLMLSAERLISTFDAARGLDGEAGAMGGVWQPLAAAQYATLDRLLRMLSELIDELEMAVAELSTLM